jgi:hypothetical protein
MKRIGILVVAYNAAGTLASVLDRIPRDFVPRITKILVNDDYSQDATYLVGLGYQQITDLPLEVIRHPSTRPANGHDEGHRDQQELAAPHALRPRGRRDLSRAQVQSPGLPELGHPCPGNSLWPFPGRVRDPTAGARR